MASSEGAIRGAQEAGAQNVPAATLYLKLAEEEREQELARERGVVSMGFGGNPIRSYILQPYQLVKDHRTDYEVGNAQGVLDGNLDPFIHAYLLARAAGKVV